MFLGKQMSQRKHVSEQTSEEIDARLGTQGALSLYAHSVTRGARSIRVAPGPTPVVWAPSLSEPEDGCTFAAANIGQWVKSHEAEVEGKIEVKGMLRPVFECACTQSDSGAGMQLRPEPRQVDCAVHLLTRAAKVFKASQLVAL